MRPVRTVAGYALQEALRRKVFAVVLVLTVAFLALYWLGTDEAFEESAGFVPPGCRSRSRGVTWPRGPITPASTRS